MSGRKCGLPWTRNYGKKPTTFGPEQIFIGPKLQQPKKGAKKANISMLMFFPLSYFIVVNDAQWARKHKQVH